MTLSQKNKKKAKGVGEEETNRNITCKSANSSLLRPQQWLGFVLIWVRVCVLDAYSYVKAKDSTPANMEISLHGSIIELGRQPLSSFQ